jgi:hypothetical protein
MRRLSPPIVPGAVRANERARLSCEGRCATTVLRFEVVRRAIEQGCRELVSPLEPYKLRYVEQEEQIKVLRMPHGPGGTFVLHALAEAGLVPPRQAGRGAVSARLAWRGGTGDELRRRCA